MTTQRIRESDLEKLAAEINEIFGAPQQPYAADENGDTRAQAGCFYIDHAYGQVALERVSKHGGSATVFERTTKRDLYNQMLAYVRGLTDGAMNAIGN